MGRGASTTSSAAAMLRAIPGGAHPETRRQPPMDPVLDRLWMSHPKELTRAARSLANATQLSGQQATTLRNRLNKLGAEVGLEPVWQIIERDGPNGRRVNAAYIVGGHPDGPMPHATHAVFLEDDFDGGLIDGMSEARYLGRKFCELRGWLAQRSSPMTGLIGRG